MQAVTIEGAIKTIIFGGEAHEQILSDRSVWGV